MFDVKSVVIKSPVEEAGAFSLASHHPRNVVGGNWHAGISHMTVSRLIKTWLTFEVQSECGNAARVRTRSLSDTTDSPLSPRP